MESAGKVRADHLERMPPMFGQSQAIEQISGCLEKKPITIKNRQLAPKNSKLRLEKSVEKRENVLPTQQNTVY